MDKGKEYELIKEFVYNGERMVIVRLEHGVHTMPLDEWKHVYGKLHPERWSEVA